VIVDAAPLSRHPPAPAPLPQPPRSRQPQPLALNPPRNPGKPASQPPQPPRERPIGQRRRSILLTLYRASCAAE
jgi:hypothetical protein